MDENKKPCEPLTENELDTVSGGVVVSPPYKKTPKPKGCKFEREMGAECRTDSIYAWWLCETSCHSGVFWTDVCKCHGTPNCVDKWHRFTLDGRHV